MAQEIEVEVEFDELTPEIEGTTVRGMMLYGTAILASSDPTSAPHEYYVKEVILDGKFRLKATGAGVMGFPSQFRKQLFKACEDALTNDRTQLGRYMQAEFSEAVRDVMGAAA